MRDESKGENTAVAGVVEKRPARREALVQPGNSDSMASGKMKFQLLVCGSHASAGDVEEDLRPGGTKEERTTTEKYRTARNRLQRATSKAGVRR